MPPHCDTLDGPVVKAAEKALENENINIVLPWVPKEAENELKEAFEKTASVRNLNREARELADRWFLETSVRLHRAGEGKSYTGLKPAGMGVGPVVPKAEEAVESESLEELMEFLQNAVREEVKNRFGRVLEKKNYSKEDVDAARGYIEAMLDFILYSHHLYEHMKGREGEGKSPRHGH